MSNLLVTFRHGCPASATIVGTPESHTDGTTYQNGEVVVNQDTGEVHICTDHDVKSTSTQFAAMAQEGDAVIEVANPNYVADSPTKVADGGAPVYVDRATPASAYNYETNPMDTVAFANDAVNSSTAVLGIVEGKDLLEGDSTFLVRFTKTKATALGAAMT